MYDTVLKRKIRKSEFVTKTHFLCALITIKDKSKV